MNWKSLIKSIDKKEGKYKIYAVLSLEKFNNYNRNDIIYIGITSKTLGKRLSAHKSKYKSNPEWPSYIGICLIENTNSKSREGYYMKVFRDLGCKLLNVNNGMKEKKQNRIKLTDKEKKERRSRYDKEYYEKNKERMNAASTKYQKSEKSKEYRKKYYREKKKNLHLGGAT